jgi:hypothetical protein
MCKVQAKPRGKASNIVMAGLDPAIHAFLRLKT